MEKSDKASRWFRLRTDFYDITRNNFKNEWLPKKTISPKTEYTRLGRKDATLSCKGRALN
jgi:hypothetical protein